LKVVNSFDIILFRNRMHMAKVKYYFCKGKLIFSLA
jgi:hypothetical protein